jgi:uncharacterized protein YjbI with pentapeptide repeats
VATGEGSGEGRAGRDSSSTSQDPYHPLFVSMASNKHVDILKRGMKSWNIWRQKNPSVKPNLKGADLRGLNLSGMDFRNANLRGAILRNADLSDTRLDGADLYNANCTSATFSRAKCYEFAGHKRVNFSQAILTNANLDRMDLTWANLRRANLRGANIMGTELYAADLKDANLAGASLNVSNLQEALVAGADLTKVDLSGACLVQTDFTKANLRGAHLDGAILNHTNLKQANLTDCSIHGISAWGLELQGSRQSNLHTNHPYEPLLTVEDIEIAQFIYLLRNSEKLRDIIDQISSKLVLVLGRFSPQRKAVLDSIKEELKKYNYTPIVFDFQKPRSRNMTETVSALAHLAKFIVADITDAKSIPQELQAIVPRLPSVPVLPLLQKSRKSYGMFADFQKYPWVSPLHRYINLSDLRRTLYSTIIRPTEVKMSDLAKQKFPEGRAFSKVEKRVSD